MLGRPPLLSDPRDQNHLIMALLGMFVMVNWLWLEVLAGAIGVPKALGLIAMTAVGWATVGMSLEVRGAVVAPKAGGILAGLLIVMPAIGLTDHVFVEGSSALTSFRPSIAILLCVAGALGVIGAVLVAPVWARAVERLAGAIIKVAWRGDPGGFD